VAVRKFVVVVLVLFSASALVTAQQRSSESLSQQIKTLNARLGAPVSEVEMRRRIRDRASLLAELIETDPSAAIAMALPEDNRAALAAAYPNEPIESSGTWEGEGRQLVEDDFAHGVSRTRYTVMIDGQEVSAFFAGQTPRFQCGRNVNVSGLRLGGRIAVTAVASGPLLLSSCSTLGQQKVAALIVSFPTIANTVSLSVVQSAFFGSGRALANYWNEASYGAASATGGVFGPFVLDKSYDCSTQSNQMLTAAIQAADSTVDFRNYTRVFIFYPKESCVGLGSVGCQTNFSPSHGSFSSSVAWIGVDSTSDNDYIVDVSSHEGGHGLGLQHTSAYYYPGEALGAPTATPVFDEYGDFFSAMGISYTFGSQTLIAQYAAPHKQQLGWLGGSSIQTVTASGNFTILPYETGSGLKAIRVQRGSTGKYLWLEYRQSLGNYDTLLSLISSNIYRGALIHYEDPEDFAHAGHTELLDFNPQTYKSVLDAVLDNGRTWTDPYSNLSITVNSATSSGLNVSVNYGGNCATISPSNRSHGAGAENGTVGVTAASNCSWTAVASDPWIGIPSGGAGTGSGTVNYSVSANVSTANRGGSINIGGNTFGISQVGCTYSLSSSGYSAPATAGSTTVTVTTPCAWTATPNDVWLSASSSAGTGNFTLTVNFTANIGPSSRAALIIIGNQAFTVTQAAPAAGCTYALSTGSYSAPASGGATSVNIITSCGWTATASDTWLTPAPGSGTGTTQVAVTIAANSGSSARASSITIGGQTFAVTQSGATGPTGLRFIPVTPCRVADTRAGQGTTGVFGPPSMPGGSTRDFPISSSTCGIPASAQAYSLNITVVPSGPLGFLTVWPSGQTRPLVSTLNALGGDIVANAAIVPAGINGAVSVFATNNTDVIVDINGYFAPASYTPPAGSSSLAFFTAVPCRVVDTRPGAGTSGAFGPPTMTGGSIRDFPISSSACGIPAAAKAYSVNITVVPSGGLAFLSAWPTGLARPVVSTLNSLQGKIVANAAIIPDGTNGAISIYVSNATDVIIDVNGYFADPGFVPLGGNPALVFYPLTPCRAVDTRPGQGTSGAFGPPNLTGGPGFRTFPIPSSACSVPSTAHAFAFNITVVPPGPLSYLTAWPSGQAQPTVSTLNSLDGSIVANAAIVPAGTGGGINLLSPEATDVVLDINGYFAQ
jgi:M6 family metalloprotease-like protein